jgi:two-component system, response regulator
MSHNRHIDYFGIFTLQRLKPQEVLSVMSSHVHHVLVVDDNIDDSFLTHRALRKVVAAHCTVNVASSGEEAIAYLMGEGEYGNRIYYPFPTLLICDLEMSPGDGFDVLEFMQSNPGWSVVPRVIFSSSSAEGNIETAYSLGASVYHMKPGSGAQFEKLLSDLLLYWSSAEVPPVDTNGHVRHASRPARLDSRFPWPAAASLHRVGH